MVEIKYIRNFNQKSKSKEDRKRKNVIDKLTYHAPKLIKKASNKTDETILSKVIQTTIEHIYQSSFEMFENFGKKQYKKSKRNHKRHLQRKQNVICSPAFI